MVHLVAPPPHDPVRPVTDVMFNRLTGVALMSSPFTSAGRSLYEGRLNSDTPINLNWFFPAGAVVGRSFAGGALAMLGTGSVAFTSVQLTAPCSLRQPVTATI